MKFDVVGVEALLLFEDSLSLPYDELVQLPSLGLALEVR